MFFGDGKVQIYGDGGYVMGVIVTAHRLVAATYQSKVAFACLVL